MVYYWKYKNVIAAYWLMASFAENRAIKSESTHVGRPGQTTKQTYSVCWHKERRFVDDIYHPLT